MKQKKKDNEQHRRNSNRFWKNINVRDLKVTKKLHVSSIFKRKNLANTLKSYSMSNLCTKYKILQKVKILQQKHLAKGNNVNQKSSTLTQCFNLFNQKTSSSPHLCMYCLQTWFRTSVHDVANLDIYVAVGKKNISRVFTGVSIS